MYNLFTIRKNIYCLTCCNIYLLVVKTAEFIHTVSTCLLGRAIDTKERPNSIALAALDISLRGHPLEAGASRFY
jgi:hypothetical protein